MEEFRKALKAARAASRVEMPRVGQPTADDPPGWLPVFADGFGGVRRIGWVQKGPKSVAWTVDFPEYEPVPTIEAAMEQMVTARQAHALGVRLLDVQAE